MRASRSPYARYPYAIRTPVRFRCAHKIFLSMASALRYQVGVVDISSESTQIDSVRHSERIIIRVPAYVKLPMGGSVEVDRGEKENGGLCFLTLRPL